MKEDRGDNVVSSAIGEWPSSLEAVLFGTNDSTQIVDLVNAFCERALGAGIDMVTFYKRGVGAAPAGLQTFIEAATPMLTSVRLPSAPPYNLRRTQLWPTPHDLRFDLTFAGGEWIDERAEVARETLERVGGAMVVGHADWRVENVRLDRTQIVAIFDWDSVCIAPEAALVGANSANFTADWSDQAVDPYPSPDEMLAFVREYETARGHAFTSDEREVAKAARLYRLAYIARCEHSDTVLDLMPSDPDHSSTALLRSMT